MFFFNYYNCHNYCIGRSCYRLFVLINHRRRRVSVPGKENTDTKNRHYLAISINTSHPSPYNENSSYLFSFANHSRLCVVHDFSTNKIFIRGEYSSLEQRCTKLDGRPQRLLTYGFKFVVGNSDVFVRYNISISVNRKKRRPANYLPFSKDGGGDNLT